MILSIAALLCLIFLYRKEMLRRKELETQLAADQLFLKKMIKEKDWLLEEISHRVKNNLQIMISLLNSQIFFMQNTAAVEAIKTSQRRLHAISLAYQNGYEGQNPSDINMNMYITELTDYLMDEYQIDSLIHCELEVENISLPITSAVPIGLILSEALSNAFQYAFAPGTEGEIQVKFIAGEVKGSYRLLIADNGMGMPPDVGPEEIHSLGRSLIQGLSNQLRGELRLKNDHGVSITVEFANLIF